MRWSAIIKQIRVSKGLKQQALASLLEVSQSAVSRWENNQDEPNLAAAKQLLAMASPSPVGNLDLFSAEADAKFCPLAISTVDPLRLVRWNEPLTRRWRLNPRPGDAAHRFMDSTWFDHYRASGIGARQMNVLLSYDETRVGRTTRFAAGRHRNGPGVGGSLSNAVAGAIVVAAGYGIAFLVLAASAFIAFLLVLVAMPETKVSAPGSALNTS